MSSKDNFLLGTLCWLQAKRSNFYVEKAPVVIIGCISHLNLYTVKRLDMHCIITRVWDFELTEMGALHQLAWIPEATEES